MRNKKLIITLIQADLKNRKMIDGLDFHLEFDADKYYLKLNELVFDLMGFDDCSTCEAIAREYFKESGHGVSIKIADETGFEKMAVKIYGLLLDYKKTLKHEALGN
ncbi:MAG: hypothetical protein ACO1O6_08680 [Bacteroidota bacterium]